MSESIPSGFGCRADIPDRRDYTSSHPRVKHLLGKLPLRSVVEHPLPTRFDGLRRFFGPVRNQASLRASAAFACVSCVEQFLWRKTGDFEELSPRFVYWLTRQLQGLQGDCGAGLRETLKAISRGRIPPESHCPYSVEGFDDAIPPLALRFGRKLPPIVYFHPISAHAPGAAILEALKYYLVAGMPIVFSLGIPNSLSAGGTIDYRPAYPRQLGGQALVAIGFDDDHRGPSGDSPAGAVMVRNSWGPGWGDAGYGWVPYEFITQRLAADYWTLLSREWLALDDNQLAHPFIFVKKFAEPGASLGLHGISTATPPLRP